MWADDIRELEGKQLKRLASERVQWRAITVPILCIGLTEAPNNDEDVDDGGIIPSNEPFYTSCLG